MRAASLSLLDLFFFCELIEGAGGDRGKKERRLNSTLLLKLLAVELFASPFFPFLLLSPYFPFYHHGPCLHAPRARPCGLHPQRCWYVESVESKREILWCFDSTPLASFLSLLLVSSHLFPLRNSLLLNPTIYNSPPRRPCRRPRQLQERRAG